MFTNSEFLKNHGNGRKLLISKFGKIYFWRMLLRIHSNSEMIFANFLLQIQSDSYLIAFGVYSKFTPVTLQLSSDFTLNSL